MFIHKTGDIFTTHQKIIGHGTNTKGIMGSGIAAIIKKKFPEVNKEYVKYCKNPGATPGDVQFVETAQKGLYIANIFSQNKTGSDAQYDWLYSSVSLAIDYAIQDGFTGLAVPRIGAGVGGLEWEKVKELLEEIGNKNDDFELEIWSLPDADKPKRKIFGRFI